MNTVSQVARTLFPKNACARRRQMRDGAPILSHLLAMCFALAPLLVMFEAYSVTA